MFCSARQRVQHPPGWSKGFIRSVFSWWLVHTYASLHLMCDGLILPLSYTLNWSENSSSDRCSRLRSASKCVTFGSYLLYESGQQQHTVLQLVPVCDNYLA